MWDLPWDKTMELLQDLEGQLFTEIAAACAVRPNRITQVTVPQILWSEEPIAFCHLRAL